jgi:uncharacterized protein (DUF433 family)
LIAQWVLYYSRLGTGERKRRFMLYNTGVKRISVRPDVDHGKPCISGTRIQVAQVLDLMAVGKSFQEVIADYFPDLTEEDLRACLEFARDLVQNEEIHVVEELGSA